MSIVPQQHEQRDHNAGRLAEIFGLTVEAMQDVIMQGFQARTGCTPNHPRTFPGIAQWAETVRALRDKTAPMGWTKRDRNNYPLIIHPSKEVAIVVTTGDEETGTLGNPSNRAPKGVNTEEAVAVNQQQLSLFADLPEWSSPSSEKEDEDDDSTHILWVLLYHVAPSEIRFELSLPMQMIGGKIRGWKERIFFPAIEIGHTDIDLGDDDGTGFEVPVERLP